MQYDYAIFALVVLCSTIGMHCWLSYRRTLGYHIIVCWCSVALLLVLGWFFVREARSSEREKLSDILRGYGVIYACELERMGHERIGLDTAPDDAAYEAMIEMEKRWLKSDPTLDDIYTMRKLSDGRKVVIVDSETDFDRDGKFDGEREARVPIGSPPPEPGESMSRFLDSGSDPAPKITTAGWGLWGANESPIFGKSGEVDAVLRLDFNPDSWVSALRIAGAKAIGELSVVVLALFGGLVVASYMAAENDAKIVTVEKAKLSALIESIDGIVWECTAKDFRFTFVSEQCRRILGYEPEEWLAEPDFWSRILHPDDQWADEYCLKMVELKKPYEYDYRLIAKSGRTVWIRESGSILLDEKGEPELLRGVYHDITMRKQASAEMERLNRSLLEVSRHAGMAEVATSVLHNVGNVLNSISVSATLAADRMKHSRASSLRQAARLLREQNGHLAEFLTEDPKGRLIPEYIDTVTEQLANDHLEMIGELSTLTGNIDHIKEIISIQQSYASVSGVFEPLCPTDLAEDALRMNDASLEGNQVRIIRQYPPNPPLVQVDRHKVLQILINLIRNAKHAVNAGGNQEKQIVMSVQSTVDGRMVAITVRDNGEGILPENLDKIFRHGFTTKKNGHGFGLHGAANFAKEMGGLLTVHSDGPNQGAEFTLVLPVAPELKIPNPRHS